MATPKDPIHLCSIAICTWNRSDLLKMTLQSLVDMNPVDFPWQLIVVDNNSSDDTASVCQSFAFQLPMKLVRESKQGHSHSRNRAVQEATGQYILWTDDDVQVNNDWLQSYADAFERHPKADFFGGAIQPVMIGKTPGWIKQNWSVCGGVYAMRDLGEKVIPFDEETLPYGANFATRRSVQLQYTFEPAFGRVADGVRGYDEIDVLTRMAKDGHQGFWVPESKLRHLIPKDRATLQYVRDYFFGQGQTWVIRGVSTDSRDEINKRLKYHQRHYLRNRWRPDTTKWFNHLVQISNLKGQLAQLAKNGVD